MRKFNRELKNEKYSLILKVIKGDLTEATKLKQAILHCDSLIGIFDAAGGNRYLKNGCLIEKSDYEALIASGIKPKFQITIVRPTNEK
jgi:hypothetical protein